jgi:long-chain acyl-CoA synthetase
MIRRSAAKQGVRLEITTLNDIYAETCEVERDAVMMVKKGDRWEKVTVPQFRDSVRWFSTGLRVLGVKPGDRVAILAENRPEWTMADFGILCAAAVTSTIPPPSRSSARRKSS